MAEPGWYDDPQYPEMARWYDGTRWTDYRIVKAEHPDGPPPPPVLPQVPPPPQAPPPQPAAAAPASGQRVRPWLKPALIVLGIIVVAGVVMTLTSGGGGDQTLQGQFALTDSDNVIGDAGDCFGTGGYDDFRPGMDVTIRNGDGTIIGSANTVSGEDFLEDAEDPDAVEEDIDAADALGWCVVFWTAEVPGDERFYEVEIGRRGELTYTRDELDENDWSVSATLG